MTTRFDAAGFLAGVFGDPAGPGERPDLAAATRPAVVAPTDAGDGDALPDWFDPSEWERRADASGRMGWERIDTPEWMAWWRRCEFTDLPQPARG